MSDEMQLLEEKALKLEIIRTQSAQLEEIQNRASQDGDFEYAFRLLRKWRQCTYEVLEKHFGSEESLDFFNKTPRLDNFDELNSSGIVDTFLELKVEQCRKPLHALVRAIESHPEEVLSFSTDSNKKSLAHDLQLSATSKTVFIIHGHDEINRLKLESLLKKWNLNPIILASQSPNGRTIIEGFEEEAKKSVYAIALLTPDDKVSDGESEYYQPRPNVFFELGWFYGLLGREKVCILLKKGTQFHSDIHGVIRFDFNDSVEDLGLKIQEQLVEAGVLEKVVL